MSKHTPGPWMWWTSNSWRRLSSYGGGDGDVLCPITQSDGHPDVYFKNGGVDGPDARLISAAPDLLEALKRIMGYAHTGAAVRDVDTNEQPEFVRALAAINKAEGKS